MEFFSNHKIVSVVLCIISAVVLIAVGEFLYITYAGKPVPVPTIPRDAQTLGSGEPLAYAVLGDSTAVGQGGDYRQGIARATAEFMADNRQVTLQNFAISGARAGDVLKNQVDKAAKLKPDIVLLAVGANDVTHVTSPSEVKHDMARIIDTLYAANPDVKIILTGSPQMGAVPRFPWPVNSYAKVRTRQVNTIISELAAEKRVTFAPIAKETGSTFYEHPELFAEDLFHPNAEGYNVWVPVLTRAIEKSLVQINRSRKAPINNKR